MDAHEQDRVPGHRLWAFFCSGDSYLQNSTYGATAITLTRERGQVTVDPKTGK